MATQIFVNLHIKELNKSVEFLPSLDIPLIHSLLMKKQPV
jgi:predicted lactoylglutathione lyase